MLTKNLRQHAFFSRMHRAATAESILIKFGTSTPWADVVIYLKQHPNRLKACKGTCTDVIRIQTQNDFCCFPSVTFEPLHYLLNFEFFFTLYCIFTVSIIRDAVCKYCVLYYSFSRCDGIFTGSQSRRIFWQH